MIRSVKLRMYVECELIFTSLPLELGHYIAHDVHELLVYVQLYEQCQVRVEEEFKLPAKRLYDYHPH
jgi:hypothetical protein